MTAAHLRNGQHLELFPVGWLASAQIDILAVLEAATWRTASYHVRYPCCGREADMRHSGIWSRIRRRTCLCADCRRRATNTHRATARRRGPLGLVDTLWPIPPSLVGQPPWSPGTASAPPETRHAHR